MWDDKDNIGSKSKTTILKYLRDIGDDEAVAELSASGGVGQGLNLGFGRQVWAHTGMVCGFLPPEATGETMPIETAFGLDPDDAIKSQRVKITLEKFWVHRYPGMGIHKILCEFTGRNQLPGDQEELRFALTTEAKDQASAAISGSPIFLGVSVGDNGIAFEGRLINVSSTGDETILNAIGSGPFKEGLGLLTTAQPALKPFVNLTSSVVQLILGRSKNTPVFNFKLGLDFTKSPTSVPLRLGSFVVVQGERAGWNWDEYSWNTSAQQIVHKVTGDAIGLNYIVFRVSPFV